MRSNGIYINGKEVTKPYFVFDGCHKFYLCEQSEFEDIESKGYDLNKDLYSVKDIAHEFFNSCPLRFIEDWTTYEKFVSQGESIVTFLINGNVITQDFSKDIVLENGLIVS